MFTQNPTRAAASRSPAPAAPGLKRRLLATGGVLALVLAGALLAWPGLDSRASQKQHYQPPAFAPFPADNPFTPAKADLGRKLFFDPRLSGSQATACATCHQPALGWTDGRQRAIGDGGGAMALRTPSLIDAAWAPILGWDGAFPDIEAVTLAAITSNGNMNLSEADAVARLAADPAYRQAFAAAFPDHRVSGTNMLAALGTFTRLIMTTGDTPFDRWIGGEPDAISPAAKRGFDLFNGRANCAGCHSGWAFTDGGFHDIGVAKGADLGRGRLFPNSVKLRYAFKTPSLRGAARGGPYMHNGSVPTLEEVIDLYDRGGIARPSRDDLIRPLHLTDAEKSDLLAFLLTLSGPISSANAAPIPPESPPSRPPVRPQSRGNAAPNSASPPINKTPA